MSSRPSDKLEKHYRIGEAAKILGITVINLREHIKAGRIQAVRTVGGHRRIPESELLELTGHPKDQAGEERKRTCVIYARVSSQKQAKAGNLARQVERLQRYAWEQGLKVIDEVTDIGSGMSETRPGLSKIFKHAREQNLGVLLIEFRDRLARYGYRYIEEYLTLNGVEIEIKEVDEQAEVKDEDLNKELVEDLISIIYSFSGKLYGRRSAKCRKLRRCVQQARKTADKEENGEPTD